jgi:hypothetical protein
MDTIGEMALNPCHIPAPASQSVNSRPKRKVLARKTINSSLYIKRGSLILIIYI